MSKPTPRQTKKLIKVLSVLITELYESGCIDYMNEASTSAKTFNRRLAAAERALAKVKE